MPTASKMESSRTFNFNLLKERITRRLGCAGDHVTDYQDVQTQRYPRDVLLAIGGWHDSSPSNHVETYGRFDTVAMTSSLRNFRSANKKMEYCDSSSGLFVGSTKSISRCDLC